MDGLKVPDHPIITETVKGAEAGQWAAAGPETSVALIKNGCPGPICFILDGEGYRQRN